LEGLYDNNLMLKVKAGELDKMGLLFERYQKTIYSFMYHSTYQAALSEDLVQNLFYRMIKYRHTYAGDGEFKTWMYFLARNVINDHYRKKTKLVYNDDIGKAGSHLVEEKSADDDLMKTQQNEELRKAVARLSDEAREIIVLSKYQELSYKEIAEIVETTEGNVKVKVHRAIGELRKIMLTSIKQ
jgi:RNA polymerase sigma factor (sigma-70 family)